MNLKKNKYFSYHNSTVKEILQESGKKKENAWEFDRVVNIKVQIRHYFHDCHFSF